MGRWISGSFTVARARDTCSVVGEDTVGDVMPSCYGARPARETAAARARPRVGGVRRIQLLALYWM